MTLVIQHYILFAVNDAVDYLKKEEKYNLRQLQLVSQSAEASHRQISPNQNCLTVDDVALAEKNLPPQQYDAFILFDDKDIEFANEMIEKVEGDGFKVRTCIPSVCQST